MHQHRQKYSRHYSFLTVAVHSVDRLLINCFCLLLIAGCSSNENSIKENKNNERNNSTVGGGNTKIELSRTKANQIVEDMTLARAEEIIGGKARRLTESDRAELRIQGVTISTPAKTTTFFWRSDTNWILIEVDESKTIKGVLSLVD